VLVVAEDSDEYLRASAKGKAGSSMGRLLNVTDGILGQGLNTLVLLTTNELHLRGWPIVMYDDHCWRWADGRYLKTGSYRNDAPCRLCLRPPRRLPKDTTRALGPSQV